MGVGNIYASEALFLAGIRPTVRASRLTRTRVASLHKAIREVLARAVNSGGSTLRDFSNADGHAGYFQLEAMVYDRAGLPCRCCASPVRQIRTIIAFIESPKVLTCGVEFRIIQKPTEVIYFNSIS